MNENKYCYDQNRNGNNDLKNNGNDGGSNGI